MSKHKKPEPRKKNKKNFLKRKKRTDNNLIVLKSL